MNVICAKIGRVSGKYVTRKSGIAVFHYTMTCFKNRLELWHSSMAREPF